MIVVDASAAAKLLLNEVDSVSVRDWFRDIAHDVLAPDLIDIEVTQAVVRRANARQITAAAARGILGEWAVFLESHVISLHRSDIAQVAIASELAMRLGHPVKDCIYLALAIELECALVTCDARFHAKATDSYPQVRLMPYLN